MSGPKWTEEQLTAIDTRGCNLLVSAAAGAGKTAVLVERIIKHITDIYNPVDVDRLLVVTFTKAAAAEMRERISAAITRELDEHPDSIHLNRQLMLLNRASITTLHSFCLDVLKKYFFKVDLDPAFRIADESEALLLQLETLEELFEEYYIEGNEEFLALVEAYGGDRDDTRLQETVLRLYNFAVSNPWPELWLNNLENSYSCQFASTVDELPGIMPIKNWIKMQLDGCTEKIERAIRLASKPEGPTPYIANLKEDLLVINDLTLAAANSWESLYKAFETAAFGKLKACRSKDIDELTKDRVKKIRDEVKKTVGKLKHDYFARNSVDQLEDLRKVSPHVNSISTLVKEFKNRFRKAKADKALVDFSDLEHFCLQVLLDPDSDPDNPKPSVEAMELREHFAEVLVDEYQDVNGVQEAILYLISRQDSENGEPPNMFMVGDVKQSIYRFRLAEPTLFMGKYTEYPREAGGTCQAVDLTRNFRSRKEVLDGVNYIFRQLMTPEVGEMPYDDKAELVCGASYAVIEKGLSTGGPVELHLLEKNVNPDADSHNDESAGEDADVDDPLELDAAQREARIVARKIREIVIGTEEAPGPQLQVFDKVAGGYRPVTFKDIVILMRATRGSANIYTDELRAAGIPVYADLGTGYFAATEIETMMSLLRVIDNPKQDIPLAAVLRSPIVNLKAEELALVRLNAPQRDSLFYDAVKESLNQENLSNETKGKLIKFMERLKNWRTMARINSLAELIWRLYDETGYYSYVGGMPGGAQRQANLRALYDRARQYEASTYRGLFRFLRFIERFQDLGNDLGTARALGENEDVVRIMSIHKSKGLEFPVVIVTGLGKQFNNADIRQEIILHKELGIGLPVVNTDLRLTYPSLNQMVIKKKLQMELLAEEMRILYVALTRAKEKLIMVGSAKDLLKNVQGWCDNVERHQWELPNADLANAKNFLDWIGPCVARHRKGATIRRLAECFLDPCGMPADDSVDWLVSLWQPEDCVISVAEDTRDNTDLLNKVKALEPVELTAGFTEEMQKRMKWSYPFENVVSKASKVSVTEAKRKFAEENADELESVSIYRKANFKRPDFLREKTGLNPAEKGSAMHLLMQHIDFKGDISEAGITTQLNGLLAKQIFTEEQAEAIDINAVADFFKTNIGQRVLQAEEVFRELPFTLALPADIVYPGIDKDQKEQVLVQGIIDCIIREGESFTLIDYKTDKMPFVKTGNEPNQEIVKEITDKYKGQLNLYAMAVEKILKSPVSEKYLYLFSTGLEIYME